MALTTTEEAQTRELIAQQAALLSLAGNETTITSKLGAQKVNLGQLPSATAIADADILLVRQGTTDKGVGASAFKTYAIPPDASTTVKGIVELADNTETQAGTDAVRAVTPAGLASRTATEARTGLAEIATQAETNAGTDDATIVTPKKLRAGFASSFGQNGYVAFPTWLGGWIIQWVRSASTSVAASAFQDGPATAWPTSFPTACYFASACSDVIQSIAGIKSGALTVSSVTPTLGNLATGSAQTIAPYIIGIGK